MRAPPQVAHRAVEAGGCRIFYREAGPADAPTLLLLHGFPSASHQFARLLDALGDRFHLVAPDYPGFGHSSGLPVQQGSAPAYTFDALADAVEALCLKLDLRRFTAYLFDYGAPVGLRLAERHPEWIAGLVIQNGNAYDEGLSALARGLVALRPGPGAATALEPVLTAEGVRGQHLGGAAHPERIPPESWVLDLAALEGPGRRAVQEELALDYHRNVEAYPRWQAWLRHHRPPALVLWGRRDPFFLPAGAEAYHRDLPEAEVHLLDAGHFALDEALPEVAVQVGAFLERVAEREHAAAGAGR
jgi:pimeloyl-ACP methyl ester carboxylesterase